MNSPNGKRAARACLATLGCGALLSGTTSGYGGLLTQAHAGSAPAEQLTLAIAWTGTQAAGVPPLLKIYNQEHPSAHWNLVENVNEQKLLAEEAAGDAPS